MHPSDVHRYIICYCARRTPCRSFDAGVLRDLINPEVKAARTTTRSGGDSFGGGIVADFPERNLEAIAGR